jgi:uncharacterized protein (DUF2126 family)
VYKDVHCGSRKYSTVPLQGKYNLADVRNLRGSAPTTYTPSKIRKHRLLQGVPDLRL